MGLTGNVTVTERWVNEVDPIAFRSPLRSWLSTANRDLPWEATSGAVGA